MLIYTFCNAQSKVTILDLLSKKPVSYATVKFYSNGEIIGGEYCDEEGTIIIPKHKKNIDRVALSCIGYENAFFNLSSDSSNVFLLIPLENILAEVVITQKKPIPLASYSKLKKSTYRLSRFQTEVVFIPNSQLLQGVLKTFSFKLSKKVKVDQNVRVHVYAKSDLKFEPGVSLLKENVIKKLPKGTNGVIEFDLIEYQITLPNEGLFIGLENIGAKTDTANFKQLEIDNEGSLFFYGESTNDFKTFVDFNKIKENSFWLNLNTFFKEDMKKSFNLELKKGFNPAFNVTIIPN